MIIYTTHIRSNIILNYAYMQHLVGKNHTHNSKCYFSVCSCLPVAVSCSTHICTEKGQQSSGLLMCNITSICPPSVTEYTGLVNSTLLSVIKHYETVIILYMFLI